MVVLEGPDGNLAAFRHGNSLEYTCTPYLEHEMKLLREICLPLPCLPETIQ